MYIFRGNLLGGMKKKNIYFYCINNLYLGISVALFFSVFIFYKYSINIFLFLFIFNT